jgi:DNA polymerase-1
MKKRLVLVDGFSILHRAYHAYPISIATSRGEIVNAVYGFVRILLKIIDDLKPSYLAVAFDLPVPTFRHKEYIGYQVQRPKMDAELEGQIKRTRQVLEAFKMPLFAKEGFEADDVIGTLAFQARSLKLKTKNSKLKTKKKKIKKEGIEVVIVTGDRDMLQLVRAGVKLYLPKRTFGEAELYDEKKTKEFLGILPKQIVDYKALIGDASDNYPGVAGIGPKTAVSLLRQFGTLEKVYRKLGVKLDGRKATLRTQKRAKRTEISLKIKDKLVAGVESVRLSQKLAKIVENVPIKLKIDDCRLHDYDKGKARELFEELEFKSLLDKLPGMKKEARSTKHEVRSTNESEQMKLV